MKSVIEIYSDIAKKNPVWSPEEEREVINRLWEKNRDRWINEALNHNLGLVFALVEKFAFNKKNEDMFQKAVCALVDALRKYDPSKNIRISTWVTKPIVWAIQQSNSSSNGSIAESISSFNYKNGTKLRVVSVDATISGGSPDKTNDTVANTLSFSSVSPDYIEVRRIKSDEDGIREDDIKRGIAILVAKIKKILNEQEITVIRGFLNGKRAVDISVDMGVCRMRISQISASAFAKIRNSDIASSLKGLIAS